MPGVLGSAAEPMTPDPKVLEALEMAYRYSDDGDGPPNPVETFYTERAQIVLDFLAEQGYEIAKRQKLEMVGYLNPNGAYVLLRRQGDESFEPVYRKVIK